MSDGRFVLRLKKEIWDKQLSVPNHLIDPVTDKQSESRKRGIQTISPYSQSIKSDVSCAKFHKSPRTPRIVSSSTKTNEILFSNPYSNNPIETWLFTENVLSNFSSVISQISPEFLSKKIAVEGDEANLSGMGILSISGLLKHMIQLRIENVQRIMRPVLHKLMQHPRNVNIFNEPVDYVSLCLPDYPFKISRPMDLGTVKSQLTKGSYTSVEGCAADISLVFLNAISYNPSSHLIHQAAIQLRDEFEADMLVIRERSARESEKKMAHVCSFCKGNSCSLCGEKCLKFEPPVLVCNGTCGQRIKRSGVFYVSPDGSRTWCQRCQTGLPAVVSEDRDGSDNTIILYKKDLLKRKLGEEVAEPWVECDDCHRRVHQICALFNDRHPNYELVRGGESGAGKGRGKGKGKEKGRANCVKFVCPLCKIEKGLQPVLGMIASVCRQLNDSKRPSTTTPLSPRGFLAKSPRMAKSPKRAKLSDQSVTPANDDVLVLTPFPVVPGPVTAFIHPVVPPLLFPSFTCSGPSPTLVEMEGNREVRADARDTPAVIPSLWPDAHSHSLLAPGRMVEVSQVGSVTPPYETKEIHEDKGHSHTHNNNEESRPIICDGTSRPLALENDETIFEQKIPENIIGDRDFDVDNQSLGDITRDCNGGQGKVKCETEVTPKLSNSSSLSAICSPPWRRPRDSLVVKRSHSFDVSSFSSRTQVSVIGAEDPPVSDFRWSIGAEQTNKDAASGMEAITYSVPKRGLDSTPYGHGQLRKRNRTVTCDDTFADSAVAGRCLSPPRLSDPSYDQSPLDSSNSKSVDDSACELGVEVMGVASLSESASQVQGAGVTDAMQQQSTAVLSDSESSTTIDDPASSSLYPFHPTTVNHVTTCTITIPSPANSAVSAIVSPVVEPSVGRNANDITQNNSDVPEVWSAKSLPRTRLSDFLESVVDDRLQGMGHGDVTDSVTVRVTSQSDHYIEVPEVIVSNLVTRGGKRVPRYLPYRQKCIMLFQCIDGVDVCLFSLYVQEFDEKCPQPNQGRVYIAYLDSVEYFRPREARTAVYHELVIGYLKWAQMRGFQYGHIWACPPQRGDSFIFWCHPAHQRTPTRDRLSAWYSSMLHRASRLGVLSHVGTLWSEFFCNYGKRDESLQRTAAKASFVGSGALGKPSATSTKQVTAASRRVSGGVADDEVEVSSGNAKASGATPVVPECPPVFEGDFWVNECLRIHRAVQSRTKCYDGDDRNANQRRARDFLKSLMLKQGSYPFNQPVNPVVLNIPTYFDIVKLPMDLGTIRNKLRTNQYSNLLQFAEDIRLTFNNAMLFNPPGHPIHTLAKDLLADSEVKIADLVMKKTECGDVESDPLDAEAVNRALASFVLGLAPLNDPLRRSLSVASVGGERDCSLPASEANGPLSTGVVDTAFLGGDGQGTAICRHVSFEIDVLSESIDQAETVEKPLRQSIDSACSELEDLDNVTVGGDSSNDVEEYLDGDLDAMSSEGERTPRQRARRESIDSVYSNPGVDGNSHNNSDPSLHNWTSEAWAQRPLSSQFNRGTSGSECPFDPAADLPFEKPQLGFKGVTSLMNELSKNVNRLKDDLFVMTFAPITSSETQSSSLSPCYFPSSGETDSARPSGGKGKGKGRMSSFMKKSITEPVEQFSARSMSMLENLLPDMSDPDEPHLSPFVDCRHTFLEMCQFRHYQFDSLRRAKHSSLLLLYHLHNASEETLRPHCSNCKCRITDLRWHCDECSSYLEVCSDCVDKGFGHQHPLVPKRVTFV